MTAERRQLTLVTLNPVRHLSIQPNFLGERFGWSQHESAVDESLMKSFDIAIQKSPEKFGWIDKCRTGFSVTNVS